MRLILGSKSPRRKQLLEECGFTFECIVKECDEIKDSSLDAQEVAIQNAILKAQAIKNDILKDDIVLTSDTVVECDGEILGKPMDQKDAYRMLRKLSGKTHRVISGVAITTKNEVKTFSEITHVTFYELEDELINQYINSGSVYDKAGSYGIQDMGRLFVKKIDGDYFNVVGLPIAKVYRELKKRF